MAGDDAQHVLRHIARQGQGGGGKGHGDDQAGGQAVDMKEGQQGNKSMVLFGRDVDDVQHLPAVGAQIGMGQGDALGQTGGAPGILEHDRVVQRVRNGLRMALRAFAKALPLKDMLAVVGDGLLGIPGLLEAVQPVERKGKGVAHAGNDEIAQRQAVA